MFTPQNPDKAAIARVKDPLPPIKQCQYCCGTVQVKENRVVYGRNFGKWPWIYKCCDCDAYVGMHPSTSIPLGTLADRATREWRKVAKELFFQWIEEQTLTRTEAYKRLALMMGLSRAETHFGMFSVEQCKEATKLLDKGLDD